ncbi:TatD family hydrolase [Tenacibaculum insulae]|uniref:TatD family hydrolase n=1 Tax=Tenacibaculum insulae TaxID=2029677 RepID=UPI003AB8546A
MNYINIHTHQIIKNTASVSILNRYPDATNFETPFSIGIHPWYINESDIDNELCFITKQLHHKNCFAIGECGLDKLCKTNFEMQLSVFKKHILLSEKYQKPLIIHCVKSFQEILQLKTALKPKQPWVIHGFNKNSQVAASLIKKGCFLSFGKSLLTSIKLQEVFKTISLDKIFLETDNAEININTIYQKAAAIKSIEIAKIKETIYQNFKNTFIK